MVARLVGRFNGESVGTSGRSAAHFWFSLGRFECPIGSLVSLWKVFWLPVGEPLGLHVFDGVHGVAGVDGVDLVDGVDEVHRVDGLEG